MNTSLREPFSFTSQRFYAFSVLALFGLHLMGELLPMRVFDLNSTYGLVLTCLLFGVYLSRFVVNSPVENKIYLIWIAWLLITRWLNGDVYLFVDFSLMITCILGFIFISAGTVLNKKDGEVFLDALTLIYAGFSVVVAILGIFVFITNTYIHIPPEDVWFTVRYDSALFSPNFLSTARLRSAPRLLMAWGLLVYQFVKRKNKVFRALIILFLTILFTAISLCHSRTTQIAFMACFVLIALLLGQVLFKGKKRVISVLGSVVLAFIFVFASYLGNDAVCKLVTNVNNTVAPAFEEYYNGLENKINEEYFGIGKSVDELLTYEKEQRELNQQASELNEASSAEETEASPATPTPKSVQSQASSADNTITANDHRSLKGNWSFTGRTWIWHSGIVSIIRDPVIAVRGLLTKQVAPTFNSVMAELYPTFRPQINMHNAFMDILMVSGLPGFILIFVWTVLLVAKMVKLFFSKLVAPEIKLLTLPIASMLIVSLGEILMFGGLDLCGIVFYLCVGAFLGQYYDVYSGKNKN